MTNVRFFAVQYDPTCPTQAGLKSLFQKSPLKNRAVDGATIYDMKHAINT